MKKFDRTKATYLFLAALLAVVFLSFSYYRVFDEFEYSTIDFRYKIRPPQPVDRDIVIVEIGDDSIAKIGKWPFPRNYHALLIKALETAGVRTIVFDVFFSEKGQGDKQFADTVRSAGNVYIPYIFELDRDNPDRTRAYATGYAAGMIDELDGTVEGTGFVNVVPDGDGKVRRVPMFVEYNGKLYLQLTFLTALKDLGYSTEDVRIEPGKKITVGEDMVIPLGEDSSMLVDYPGRWGESFRHYSYVDIIQSYLADITGQEPSVDLAELTGSVCFIGMTATASPDAHPSPIEPMYPGIGVHTSVYNSILKNEYLRRLDRWSNMLVLALMWILTAYVTLKARKRFAILSILLLMAGYTGAAMLLFWPGGVWVDIFYPLVSMAVIYIIFTFKKYVAETQRRELIEKELDIAKDIQRSFLPKETPGVGTLKVGSKMITARQVGGDLYDVVDLGGGKLGIMMGDVSGKGVPAALYMAKVVSVFRTYINEGSPGEVLKKVNERLVSESATNLFVTLTYMVFDTVTNRAEFSIGGHMPTVLIEPDGNVRLLDVSEGMPLGMIECDFGEASCDMKPGSVFVLYTDGVTEAMDTKGEMYLEKRLVKLCCGLKGRSVEDIVDAIHKSVADFAGKAPQHDDITVMAIKV
jgi:adenylate cyclase